MSKKIRKAVRCYLIKDNKVLVIKYKQGSIKEGYYDIPGGKIEDGETNEEAVIREMKEETGVQVEKLKLKGNIIIEYPNKVFDIDVFFSDESEGETQEFEENVSEWIDIEKLLHKKRKLATVYPLNRTFIKGLIEEKCKLFMNILVDDNENVINVKSCLEEEKEDVR